MTTTRMVTQHMADVTTYIWFQHHANRTEAHIFWAITVKSSPTFGVLFYITISTSYYHPGHLKAKYAL